VPSWPSPPESRSATADRHQEEATDREAEVDLEAGIDGAEVARDLDDAHEAEAARLAVVVLEVDVAGRIAARQTNAGKRVDPEVAPAALAPEAADARAHEHQLHQPKCFVRVSPAKSHFFSKKFSEKNPSRKSLCLLSYT